MFQTNGPLRKLGAGSLLGLLFWVFQGSQLLEYVIEQDHVSRLPISDISDPRILCIRCIIEKPSPKD